MPRFAVPAAPKCARCNTSVFLAEQVIGPASRPYHKTCLTCVVCNKRLDSTLLVEHDGEPYCKNCHKEHLGTGKGGFGKAVTLNPTSPKSPRSPVANLANATRSPIGTPSRAGTLSQQPFSTPETTLRGQFDTARRSPSPTKFAPGASLLGSQDQVPGISIRARGLASPPSPTKPSSPLAPQHSGRSGVSGSTAQIRSIDEAVAAGAIDMDDPVARIQAAVGGMSIASTPRTPSAYANKDPSDANPSTPAPNQSASGHTIPSVDYYATPSPPAPTSRATPSRSQYTQETTFADDGTPVTIQTRRVAATDTIGSVRFTGTSNPTASPTPTSKVNIQSPLSAIGTLPPPRRPDPKTLTGASGTAKIAPPRSIQVSSTTGSDESLASRRKSGIDRIGLSSSIVDASGGTPLCARCARPVYFAEQKAAAGRKWHRACLRCDGCNTTLESGKLEEGPVDGGGLKGGANVWCRVCYAKYFGPKNLAVGLSLPDTMR